MRAPDPQHAAAYLTEIMGLRRTLEGNDRVFLSCNDKHHEIEFLAGDHAAVDHLGLEVESEADLERLREAILADGQEIVEDSVDEPGLGRAFRATTPAGAVFEIYTAMEREPLSIRHYMPPLARRFGHVSFGCPDPAEMERFLVDVLGFRVTDRLFDRRWLRCGVEHHGIALFESERTFPFLHHYAFQMENWGAIERYCDHLAFLGKPLVWGPGRHGPGRNIYTYLPDPQNTIVEAYTDLLEVFDEAAYEPIDWTDSGYAALNLWGPGPPPEWRDYGIPLATPEVARTPDTPEVHA